jgi:cytochrome c peroxidase
MASRTQILFRPGRWTLMLVLAIGSASSVGMETVNAEEADDLLQKAGKFFAPLPADMATKERPISPKLVHLGRMLFFEPRASVDGTVSCSRCHLAALYGTDGLPKARGARDKELARNVPTVFNAALQFRVHWDGGNLDVEMQAHGALGGQAFGNPNRASGLAKLKAIPEYEPLFREAFPDAKETITVDQWAQAIGAYERTLVSPSRFDDYLRGKRDALTPLEQQGLKTFLAVGCAECHLGPVVGGTKFEKFGVVSDYWTETHSKEIDKGRFDITQKPEDLYVFKVPGLRNVAMTPPYFHDGSVESLSDAVQIMAKVQLGETLETDDLQRIVAFLECLTGSIPANFQQAPVLPAAGFRSITVAEETPQSK